MRVVLAILSYIAFAFSVPGIDPGMRMVALFVLFAGAVLCVYYRDECLERFPLAHFFVLAAAVVWAGFSIQDGYVCELLLPSMIAGLLLYFQRPENPKYALGGTCVFLLITWLLLFSPPSYQETLFPSLQQPEAINKQFVLASSGSVIDEYAVSQVIFPAAPLKSSLLFVCLCLTIVLLFTFTFHAITTSARNVFLLILFIVCTGFSLLFGYQPAWIGGLCALLFSVFISTEVWTWKSKAVVIILGGVLAGCALISIQIPLLSSTPLPQLDWYWQARNSENQAWGALGVFQPLSTLGAPISILATFIIAGCIFALLARRSIGFKKSDVIFPACIVLLLTAGAGTYSAVESMIAHPLLWLGLSLLCPKNEERENTEAHDENLGLEMPLPIWKRPEASAVAGLLLLLTLIAYSYLNVQRTYNSRFNEFLGEKIVSQRNLLLDELREIAPYRPEGAALYAMHHLRTAIESNRMPDEQTIQKIELALTTCARYDVAPLFAYKRLSDVYLIRADSGRALLTFERAVQAFPSLVVLRELYADLLRTVGKYDQAIIQYKIASNLEPASPRLRSKIALIYKSVGKTGDYQIEQRKSDILSPNQVNN